MKLTISLLLAKFVCANLAIKVSAVNLLNSGVAISSIFFVIVSFFD